MFVTFVMSSPRSPHSVGVIVMGETPDAEITVVALAAAAVGYLIGVAQASKSMRIQSNQTVDLERWR